MQAAMPALGAEDELARFEAGDLDLDGFNHAEHVRIGHALLQRYDFAEAAYRFSNGLRSMASKGGAAGLYHETITIAFLSLIAERSERGQPFHAFQQANAELFLKSALRSYYSAERLASDTARRTFLLPNLPCR